MADEASAKPREIEAGTSTEKVQLPKEVKDKTDAIFKKMDLDGDGEVTMEEAAKFFKSFGKVSAKAMFNEVDGDGDKSLTIIEWDSFWANVLASDYELADVLEELEGLEKGEAWVDFDDGRTT